MIVLAAWAAASGLDRLGRYGSRLPSVLVANSSGFVFTSSALIRLRAELSPGNVTKWVAGFILLRIFQRYSSRALDGGIGPHQLRILKSGFSRTSTSWTVRVGCLGTTSPNSPGMNQRT